MKIGIIGGGISGLSIGRMLSKNNDVEILEKNSVYGGIARTKTIDGHTYHPVGGHCFNSKYPDVLNFVFNEIMDISQWHLVRRDAVIKLRGHEVSYPIEFAIQQIYKIDPMLAMEATSDFLAAKDDNEYENLEDWFRKKFGDKLSDEYFIPYNTKIWNKPPSQMSPAWVDGKLPIPNKESFFKGLISTEDDKMPHSNFYYPNTNNQNTFIDKLAEGLNIVLNYDVDTIVKLENSKWLVNGQKQFDLLISTMPLNILPTKLEGTPENILSAAAKLKYNKVSTVFWETEPTERTWTYVPDATNLFHRYIHIGSFFTPRANYTMTEAVGEKREQDMIANGMADPFLKNALDFNVSDHAYVVFDENYESATTNIKNYLAEKGLYTLGRFGEWQYYNMDVCIKSGLDLYEKLKEKSIVL